MNKALFVALFSMFAAACQAASSGGFPSKPTVQAVTVQNADSQAMIRFRNTAALPPLRNWRVVPVGGGLYFDKCSNDWATCNNYLNFISDVSSTAAQAFFEMGPSGTVDFSAGSVSINDGSGTANLSVNGRSVGQVGTFPWTLSGFGSPVTGTATYSRAGGGVCITFGHTGGVLIAGATSNDTAKVLSGWPLGIAPASRHMALVRVTDNGGAAQVGYVDFPTGSNTANVYPSLTAGGSWTASGTATIAAFTACWATP